VYTLARNYYAPGYDHDDLLQEATIGFYGAVRNYRTGLGSFRAFVILCVRRQLITLVKSATRSKHKILNNAVSLDRPRHEEWDEPLIDRLIVRGVQFGSPDVLSIDDFVPLLFNRCSILERHVLKMQLAGYRTREIAIECGIAEKAVSNAQWRVVAKARRLLSERGERLPITSLG
jgi:RNA polymerase sporulation-specific sigma factor